MTEPYDETQETSAEDMGFSVDYLSYLNTMPGMAAAATVKKKETSTVMGAGRSVISGSDISEQEEQENINLGSLVEEINKRNKEKLQEEEEKRQKSILEAEEEERRLREERHALLLKERYEKEKEEREEYLRAEAERARQEEEEELRRRQESLLYRTGEVTKNITSRVSSFAKEQRQSLFEKAKKKQEENQEKKKQRELEQEEAKLRKLQEEKERATRIEEFDKKSEKPSKEKSEKETKAKNPPKKEKESKGVPFFSKKNKEEKREEIATAKEEKKEKPSKEKSPKEKDYKYIALHDSLTDLLNQAAWEELKQKSVKEGSAVLFIDANGLKLANDYLGHEKGNLLLTTIADSLREQFGAKHCYRIGGDEFTVFIEDISEGEIKRNLAKFRIALEDETKKREDGLFFSVSIGTAFSKEGKETLEDLCAKADKEMYKAKELFKKTHPELDARNPASKNYFTKKTGATESSGNLSDEEYDDLLNQEHRELKNLVRGIHQKPDPEKTERIISEIQRRASEIYGILITDRTFNYLFIFQDAESFLDMVLSDEIDLDDMDYSYLYVIYQGGPQYYASDDYTSEITHIFEEIANIMRRTGTLSDKTLLKIKGIEIFRNIQFC